MCIPAIRVIFLEHGRVQDTEVHELGLVGYLELFQNNLHLPWVGTGAVREDLDWLNHCYYNL